MSLIDMLRRRHERPGGHFPGCRRGASLPANPRTWWYLTPTKRGRLMPSGSGASRRTPRTRDGRYAVGPSAQSYRRSHCVRRRGVIADLIAGTGPTGLFGISVPGAGLPAWVNSVRAAVEPHRRARRPARDRVGQHRERPMCSVPAGVRLAAATLLLDAGKGAVAVAFVEPLGPEPAAWAALAAVVGHMFPVWLLFRGGKGVATTFGALTRPRMAGCTRGRGRPGWDLAAISRRSSVGAIGALVLGTPALLWSLLELQRAGHLPISLPGDPAHLPSLAVIALLVALRHHSNIRRLIAGTEPEISLSRSASNRDDSTEGR